MNWVCRNAGGKGKPSQYHSADSMARDATNVSNPSIQIFITVSLSANVCLMSRRCPAVAGLFWFHKPLQAVHGVLTPVHGDSHNLFPSKSSSTPQGLLRRRAKEGRVMHALPQSHNFT